MSYLGCERESFRIKIGIIFYCVQDLESSLQKMANVTFAFLEHYFPEKICTGMRIVFGAKCKTKHNFTDKLKTVGRK